MNSTSWIKYKNIYIRLMVKELNSIRMYTVNIWLQKYSQLRKLIKQFIQENVNITASATILYTSYAQELSISILLV